MLNRYNPAYKYYLPWRVLMHNMNALTEKADENQTIDKMTGQFCVWQSWKQHSNPFGK